MQTFARISPNKKGQPLKVSFAIQALDPLGLNFGQRVQARIEGDTLILTPDPDGTHVVQAMSKPNGKRQSPHVSLGLLLGAYQGETPLDRRPVAAEVVDGTLRIELRTPITEEEYRWRRWGTSTRQESWPMSPEGVLHLSDQRTQNVIVPLSTKMLAELAVEADRLRLTLPTYIAHVLATVDRSGVGQPVVPNWRSGGRQVRQAREQQAPLTADEMIARGIPPASDEAWLRARVEEGLTYAEMAEHYGGSNGVYSKWAVRFGIRRDRGESMRRAYKAGRRGGSS